MGRKAVWWVTEALFVWISLVFALASFGTSIATRISPTFWGLGYLLSILAMPILLINVLFLIWWLIRRYWSIALIPILAISFQYKTIKGYINFGNQTNRAIENLGSYTVASYNIHEFRGKNNIPGSVILPLSELLIQNQVDVVCFQEFKQAQKFTADTIAKVLGMSYYALASRKNQDFFYDVAIFSKYPIIDQGLIEIMSPTRVAQWANIEFPDGVVSVINCHLQSTQLFATSKMLSRAVETWDLSSIDGVVQHQVSGLIQSSKLRAEQAQLIVKHSNKVRLPLLLCGDLNSPPNSYAYNLIAQNFTDSFVFSENLTEPTYSVLKQKLRIDYVFHNSQIFPLNHRTVVSELSDHNPVLFRFQIREI